MIAVPAAGKHYLVFFKHSPSLSPSRSCASSVVKYPIKDFSELNFGSPSFLCHKEGVLYKRSPRFLDVYDPVSVEFGNVVEGELRGARVVHDERSADALYQQYLAVARDILEVCEAGFCKKSLEAFLPMKKPWRLLRSIIQKVENTNLTGQVCSKRFAKALVLS